MIPTAEYQQLRQKVLKEEDFTCRQCGYSLKQLQQRIPGVPAYAKGHWEVDHIIPRMCGGADTQNNLQVLCHKCHLKKSIKQRLNARKMYRAFRYFYKLLEGAAGQPSINKQAGPTAPSEAGEKNER